MFHWPLDSSCDHPTEVGPMPYVTWYPATSWLRTNHEVWEPRRNIPYGQETMWQSEKQSREIKENIHWGSCDYLTDWEGPTSTKAYHGSGDYVTKEQMLSRETFREYSKRSPDHATQGKAKSGERKEYSPRLKRSSDLEIKHMLLVT